MPAREWEAATNTPEAFGGLIASGVARYTNGVTAATIATEQSSTARAPGTARCDLTCPPAMASEGRGGHSEPCGTH